MSRDRKAPAATGAPKTNALGTVPNNSTTLPGAEASSLDWAEFYVSQLNLALVRIPRGQKGPTYKAWNDTENAVTTTTDARDWWGNDSTLGMGALHQASGTATVDFDHDGAEIALRSVGVIVADVLAEATAKSIGDPDRLPKPWFRVPAGISLRNRKLTWPSPIPGDKPICVFELRAAGQDVLPPSMHPLGTPYTWALFGGFSDLPSVLLHLWTEWDNLLPQMQSACPWSDATPKSESDGPTHNTGNGRSMWDSARADIRARYSIEDALREAGKIQ